jgi:(2Fe-2S) ferredoxin/ubiquinone/menaquinone biosynthesis C-methylase UbiE
MEPFRFHLFVCTQQKPEGIPSCPTAGAFAVLEALGCEVQASGLDNDVQLTTSGCMGLCDEGPIMVVYPEGVWYRKVTPADVPEIVHAHLHGGRPVERLIWNDAPAMKTMSAEHRDKFRAAMAARDRSGMLPEKLDALIRGYMPSRVILTALELDLFTLIGEGLTTEEAAKTLHVSKRGIDALMNALVSLGLLKKRGKIFQNTAETTRYFTLGSPNNHRNGLLHTANIWHRWSTMTDAVRSGSAIHIEREDSPEWTRNFIAGMDRNATLRAPILVKHIGALGVSRLLDLGGGSGAYSIAFAKANPELKAEILDIPAVAPLTEDYIKNTGVANQINVRAGDMLAGNYGNGFDLVMLNAICHMFSPEQNQQVLRHAYQSLAPGGRLVIQDFILDPEKTSPQFAALFSLNMLVATESGASYNEAEYTEWLKTVGFPEVTRINLPGPSALIVAMKR